MSGRSGSQARRPEAPAGSAGQAPLAVVAAPPPPPRAVARSGGLVAWSFP